MSESLICDICRATVGPNYAVGWHHVELLGTAMIRFGRGHEIEHICPDCWDIMLVAAKDRLS